MKDFIINTTDGAFNSDDVKDIGSNPQPFNSNVAEATEWAEELDRYDDFSSLKIKAFSYEGTKDTGIYGIQRAELHRAANSNSVILDHQQKAGLEFLRDLRGFGLLADVVGSGKTYEACTVISELALRGKIKSLLLVVPDQTYEMWKEVLEKQFGLGKGVLQEVGNIAIFDKIEESNYGRSDFKRITSPVIVKTEDFAQWKLESLKNILFDAIVVDEAHHLCSESGQYAKALRLLAYMMIIKRKTNIPYCILLSATPHSGNLENMFRLWYFIRCKGGEPSDFEVKDDKDRTEKYRKEKDFYLSTVCRGAPTVAEYVAVSKKYELEGRGNVKTTFTDDFYKFISQKCTLDSYAVKLKGEKRILRDEFLNLPQNSKIKDAVMQKIAESYHNGVMRSIMIRQPNNVPKSRNAINYYFYPVIGKVVSGECKYKGVDFNAVYDDFYAKNAFCINGTDKSFKELCKYFDSENSEDIANEILISQILGRLRSFDDNKLFSKKNSQAYYWEQFKDTKSDSVENIVRIVNNYSDSVLDAKYKEFVKIVKQYPSDRILVFFDYDLNENDRNYSQWETLNEKLQANDKDVFERVIYAAVASNATVTSGKKSEIMEQFRKQENAILIVGDSAFTEGVNLQDAHLVINFQVTPDPLAMDQRIGRVFRLGQTRDVKIISFAAMNELEGYSLAYFNRIGLMHNTNGDATIIAGSNNEHMVAIQCPSCKRVKLLSEYEYSEQKDKLFCIQKESCIQNDARGTKMEEINVYEFKCDQCNAMLTRGNGDEGYKCFATNNSTRGKLYNCSEVGNRKYSCSKICVMKHCNKFEGELGERCLIMQKIKKGKQPSIANCILLCNQCEERGRLCPTQCYIKPGESMHDSITACMSCEYAQCRPKPHILKFDENWVAECPSCGKTRYGKLRPVVSRTFATYIKAAYDFNDGGESFCNNFLNEAQKTEYIRIILEKDSMINQK